jgi:hydroxyacylglutathione hydrolase
MIFKRIKSEGLAHNSYFIGSGGQAAVIDPRRDIQVYLDSALEQGMRISHIFETHRNEDYVIGSVPLAAAAGAAVFHGPRQDWKYGNIAADGQEFRLGKLLLKVLYTPGHTPDSLSLSLTDTATGNAPVMVFTGDALFVGDTGRVDFLGPAEIPGMAAHLYNSIFNKILPLGDGVILCPAHGGGSVCGQAIADRDESTLGIERLQNLVLGEKNLEGFVRRKAAEQHERPPYFAMMEKYNLEGPPPLPGLPPQLTPAEFKTGMEKGAIVVDTSLPPAFAGAHIRGSYSIWLDGLPDFAGWFLPYDRPLLLVLQDPQHLQKAVNFLRRLGYDRICGFIRDGVEGWYNAGYSLESLPLLSVQQLKEKLDRREDLVVLDVRRQAEWDSGHIAGSMHIYTGHLEQRLAEIPAGKPVAVLCSVGHRAGISASILLRAGFPSVFSVPGSINAWRLAGYPLTAAPSYRM